MSEGGALILMNTTVHVGQYVHLQFRVAETTFCEATGDVLRVMPFGAGQGIAIEFNIASPEFLNFMRNLTAANEGKKPLLLGDIEDLVINLG